jgi:hypothetical protein
MKPSDLGLFFVRRLMITDSISLLVTGLFMLSVAAQYSCLFEEYFF